MRERGRREGWREGRRLGGREGEGGWERTRGRERYLWSFKPRVRSEGRRNLQEEETFKEEETFFLEEGFFALKEEGRRNFLRSEGRRNMSDSNRGCGAGRGKSHRSPGHQRSRPRGVFDV